MKKALAVILTLVLVLGMLPIIGVSAADEGDAPSTPTGPQAISSAAGFTAMDPAGSYYLTGDITIDSTFPGKFTGTLDGKGFAITTSVPLFSEIEATVSNLTIKGNIVSATADYLGALSGIVTGGTYTKITNEANVENTNQNASGYACAAGLFGYLTKDNLITVSEFTNKGTIHSYECAAGALADTAKGAKADFSKCVNIGNITGDTNSTGGIVGLGESNGDNRAAMSFIDCENSGTIKSGSDSAGGICAYGQGYASYIFKNCKNTGNVSSDSGGYNSGGILGDGDGVMTFENCLNTGNVSHGGKHAGGIVGEITDTATFTNCFNTGDITAVKMASGIAGGVNKPTFEYCGNTGKITAGTDTGSGILSYCKPSADSAPSFKYCFNTGDISGGDCITGITGYFNSTTEAKLIGCFNTGKLTVTAGGYKSCALYYSNYGTDLTAGNITGSYYLADCAEYEGHFKPEADQYIALDAAKSVTAADVASGKLCYLLNEAAGANIYFQTIGEDAAPTLDNTRGTVYKVGEAFSNSPDTSDMTEITAVAVVAVVSILGMGITAVALKRKVND